MIVETPLAATGASVGIDRPALVRLGESGATGVAVVEWGKTRRGDAGMSVEEKLRLLGMEPVMSSKLHIDNRDKPGYTYCGLRKARQLRDYADQEKSVWCKRCLRAISAVPKPAYLVRKPPAIRRMARPSLVLHKRFSSIALTRPPKTNRYRPRRPNAPRWPPNTKYIVDGRPLDKDRWVLTFDGERDPEFKIPCPEGTKRIKDGLFLDAYGRKLTGDRERNKWFKEPSPLGEKRSEGPKRDNSMGRRRSGGP